MKAKTRRLLLGILGGFVVFVAFVVSRFFCFSGWMRYGISLDECPDGKPRQTLVGYADSLRRDAVGSIRIGAVAHYTTGPATEDRTTWLSRFSADAFLVQNGQETPLKPEKGWTSAGDFQAAQVKLPQVNDGDYLLRFKVKSGLEDSQTLDVPLPIYAPAQIHVLTDRPLYEPGNQVKFRAVALRARDLAPLDGRPGIWLITDPTGETLLEERSPAGPWGVAAGTFPLDSGAQSGDWKVRWVSGDASGEQTFRVEPFTLPRFKVEANASKAFYRPGDKPIVRGSVTYSSGAPVVDAKVAITWNVLGEWPPPLEWMAKTLPKNATTDKGGRFTLDLPVIPGDLRGQVTLAANLEATDPAGDRVTGSVSALLAQEPIVVTAVTEIGNGLVEGFNNRMYLRVTDAGGAVLPKAELTVKRAWDPSDKGIVAVADEDGVASVQVDPGPAVNVVIPPMPYRPRPKPAVVTLSQIDDLLTGEEPSLGDRKALDGWLGALEPCARFVHGSDSVSLGVRVDSGGAVIAVGTDARPLSRCVWQVVKEKRMVPGPERLYQLAYSFGDPGLTDLEPAIQGVPEEPEGLEEMIHEASSDARSCLNRGLGEQMQLERFATWRTTKGSKEVVVTWANLPKGEERRLQANACVESRFQGMQLKEPVDHPAVGFVTFSAVPYIEPGEERPQATVMLGYEFTVSAKAGNEPLGSAKLRLTPGAVPSIRLRLTPVLATAGGDLKLEILRGPDFNGELPEKVWLSNAGRSFEALTDKEHRNATFKLPNDVEGWLQVSWGGAQAFAYVTPKANLSVTLKSEQERYAPGQTAKLLLETKASQKGVAAAVGLFGVDESLSQLVPLPGPDAMAKLRPQATMVSQAFGTLDAQALSMGRVRGANAAAAIVARVASPPTAAELDRWISAQNQQAFTPIEALTDNFYGVLTELHVQTRAWEKEAPAAEKMHPQKMAELWKKAIAACQQRKEGVEDAYGRTLRLSQLPGELLALVDPRMVVVQGTRLPEDVENWQAWVAKEEP
ncbi:MAG: MG2 domain-containing protein [Myxococcales bacterium]